ncbi:glycosyltransferase family 4 protein [Fibrella forsythiae]|uniref:Glycosyltransferase family 4 protein n=1 Tax=Fibrella forsythiae TaxID=2817061 RepID=A0ABS3JQW4_9BACT|nr:glycosyltransferase family 1 protein [Fibrella forsythiae]MBO0952405.1 glycosyltransferase family 4 protein [Fibrella forsythiae]
MDIVFDASLLGIGHFHPQARTGVNRVAEHLVRGLADSPDVALSLAAPTHLSETLRWVEDVMPEYHLPFANRGGELQLAEWEKNLLRGMNTRSLLSKSLRHVFYKGRRAIGLDSSRIMLDRYPTKTIYHSPFFAIPNYVGSDRRIQKLLTVNDLIPIHHPEWFISGEQAVQQAIRTLSSDAHVITVSEATKDDFCQYTGFDPGRVTPIYLAASRRLFYPVTDSDRLQLTQQRYGLKDEPYLLSIATLEPRKNIRHLVQCFAMLVAENAIPAEFKLVLVGTKGWKMDEWLKEIRASEQLLSRIIFTGYVPDEDLAALYSGATAFLFPSLYEGFGLPPLEAMQCGLPVITSNVSSLPEVVGDAAIMVSPTDADALCQAMIDVVSSDDLQHQLRVKALQRSKLFSWEKFTRQHIDVYRNLSNS